MVPRGPDSWSLAETGLTTDGQGMLRIVAVPAGTVVVEVHDLPMLDDVLLAAARAASQSRCDLTLVHPLAVEERFGTDPGLLREVIAAVVEAGQEVLADAHAVVRRAAPTVRVREVLRLVDGETAIAELAGTAVAVFGVPVTGP